MRELGRRAEFLDGQLTRLDELIVPLVTSRAPGLLALYGIGPDTAALLLIAKYWLAAFTWRGIASRHVWRYLGLWAAGTAGFAALALVFWNVLRIYLPADTYRLQSLLVLLALLAVPLARVGLAPAFLAGNRHR